METCEIIYHMLQLVQFKRLTKIIFISIEQNFSKFKSFKFCISDQTSKHYMFPM